ncbi:MAG: mitochondrial fission ELM1 family protein [Alphaproteobacteria bacterium]|nr:mitochondrial fission ELM1 family protein [Alphaproteobacteria bacterium]
MSNSSNLNKELKSMKTWILTDGQKGMVNQCLGLTSALGISAFSKDINLNIPWKWLPPSLTPKQFYIISDYKNYISPPWPDLLIATGRKSVAPALAVKKANNGKTFCVQIQNPGACYKRFDTVVVPFHDKISGDNVISTLGSLHGVTPKVLDEAKQRFLGDIASIPRPLVTVLLGGSNSTYRMNRTISNKIASDLLHLCSSKGYGLAISSSPRTPLETIKIIKDRLTDKINEKKVFFWYGNGSNPYMSFLAHADAILITSDSVNMISEASATGKPISVLHLPNASNKFNRFHTAMNQAGVTRPFKGDIESWSYKIPDYMKDVASEILIRMDK